MTSTPTRPAAFFDLDRTLIGVDSAYLYANYGRRRGRITLMQFLKATVWVGLYHLSLVDIERAFAQAVRMYRGAHDDGLNQITTDFFHDQVVPTFQPGAEDALSFHRGEDHPLVLLTASSSYMSRLAVETWDLDHWLCNIFPTNETGHLHGTFERPICYGVGKVHRASHWARQHNVDLGRSYFYTDSHSDLPMLEAVGFPRVVNPDPRLRRTAQRRSWPIEDWSITP